MFFSNGSIPPHESNKDAFKLCRSAEKAKEHCPHRWQAIQRWFTETREVKAGGGGRGSALNNRCGSVHQIYDLQLENVEFGRFILRFTKMLICWRDLKCFSAQAAVKIFLRLKTLKLP